MNKIVLILSASLMLTGAVVTGCSSPASEVENAQDKVAEANNNLDKANEEYVKDIENYKKQGADKIAANEKTLADLNAKVENETAKGKAERKKKIADLELRNSEMKKKLADYKPDGQQKWDAFKAECNHDLDGLGKAFEDLTVKNVE
jgi:hypothetical protein